NKHALLDVTPKAVNTLNYTQWYPIVIFLNPDSKQGVKAMRQRAVPHSGRSARKLYVQALKLRKACSHLFTGTIQLNSANDAWYSSLKDSIQQQQLQGVWVSEGKLERLEAQLDGPDAELVSYLSNMSTDYLSVDGRPDAADAEDASAVRGPQGSAVPGVPGEPDSDLVDHGPEPPLAYISPMSRVLSKEVLYECSPDFESPPSKLDAPSPTPVTRPDTPQVKMAFGEEVELALLPSHPHECILQNLQLSDTSAYNYKYMSSDGSSSTTDCQSAATPPAAQTCPKSSHNSVGKSLGGVPSSGSSPQRDVPRHASVAIGYPVTDRDFRQQHEEGGKGDKRRSLAEEPLAQSFRGKIQAFERMDHLARTQRIRELQEARNARLELAQNPQDIYSVPVKTPKLELNPPQPLCSSSSSSGPEPRSSSPLPFYHPEVHPSPPAAEMGDPHNYWLANCVRQNYKAVNSHNNFHFT
ncbi:hypothetical protein CRUP_020289, partial [Coryphaenoides rupestris]